MSNERQENGLPSLTPRRGEPRTPEPRQEPEIRAPAAPSAPRVKRKRAAAQSNTKKSSKKKMKVTRRNTGEEGVANEQEQGHEEGQSNPDQSDVDEIPVDNKYPIRRILAQKSTSTWRKEYLVEYFPTWESEETLTLQGKALKIWERNRRKGYTFDFEDRFLTRKIVLKATNPTSDNDPMLARQMLDTVMDEVKKVLNRPGLLDNLFMTNEWVFRATGEEMKAIARAEELGDPTPNAAQVMQCTVEHIRRGVRGGYTYQQMLGEMARYLPYQKIEVCYVGQIDDTIAQPASRGERNYGTVLSFLHPMYELAQQDLDSAPWEASQLRTRLASLALSVDKVIRKSTYLLKKEHVWPLFFVRLFILADDIKKKLNPQPDPRKTNQKTQKYEISQDWHEQTRDWLLQAYSEKVFGRWDSRALEYIERTYLQCRNGVMQRVEDAKKLTVGEQVSEDEEDGDETDEADELDSDIAASDAEDKKRDGSHGEGDGEDGPYEEGETTDESDEEYEEETEEEVENDS